MDCEKLLDDIYAKINNAREKAYSEGIRKPVFNVYISQEQYRELRGYVVQLSIAEQIFLGVDKEKMMGQNVIKLEDPPYIKLAIE